MCNVDSSVCLYIMYFFDFFSTMGMAARKQRGELDRRIKACKAATLDEVNQALNEHLAATATMVVGLMVSLILGMILLDNYKAYQQNKIVFGHWIEQTYQVKVDYKHADQWDCYLDILHYPQRGSSAIAPYPNTIECDSAAFTYKKQDLSIEKAGVVLLLWSIGFLTAVLAFVLGFFWRRWITQPTLAWTKPHALIK